MTKVFFDGNCPVCKREINLYKRLNTKNNITWYDISNDKEALKLLNKKKKDCLKRLHVLDDEYNLNIGIDAFIVIWRQVKYFRYLAIIADLGIIKLVLNYAYSNYANYRYKKLYKK